MIGVVILNWNGWRETLQCISSLRKLRGDFHIVLVENGSLDDSFEQLSTHLSREWKLTVTEPGEEIVPLVSSQARERLTLVRVRKNVGFAGGCNRGTSVALRLGCDGIFFLNNDAWIEGDSFETLERAHSEHPNAIIGVCTTDPATQEVSFPGYRWPHVLYGSGKIRVPGEAGIWRTGYVEGSALYVPRGLCSKIIERYGSLYDENLFLYCEDVDLSLRAQELGDGGFLINGLKVFHKGSVSGGGTGNKYAYYYITRNRLHLARRWLGPMHRCVFVPYYLFSRVLLQVWRRPSRSRQIRSAVWQGLKDGLLGKTGEWNA